MFYILCMSNTAKQEKEGDRITVFSCVLHTTFQFSLPPPSVLFSVHWIAIAGVCACVSVFFFSTNFELLYVCVLVRCFYSLTNLFDETSQRKGGNIILGKLSIALSHCS